MALIDFDLYNQPILCKFCGKPVESIQIKDSNQVMREYTVGDILDNRTNTGVIEGIVLCYHASERVIAYPLPDQCVYAAVWHHIFIGMYDSYDAAEQAMKHFGMGELFLLYNKINDERDSLFFWIAKLEPFIRYIYEFANLPESERQSIMDGTKTDSTDNRWRRYRRFLKKPNPVEAFLKSPEAPRHKDPC
ncbi:MAG: hypothetical protein JW839_22300 [Candidatus Lokiarchaeota archaeon]|nr:hypothetical protein [Candidatus Lokiarchaeota archaeon]